MSKAAVEKSVPTALAGVHSINHFALLSKDVDAMAAFIGTMGLRADPETGGIAVRGSESDHVWAKILPGPGKRLHFISFGCFESDLEQIRKQVVDAGAELIAPPQGGDAQGFWFSDPDGIPIQVKIAPKLQPDTKRVTDSLDTPAGEAAAPMRSLAPHTGATRLSHLALFVSDFNRSLEFYKATLGLWLADRSGDIIAFTYGRHGCDHHLIAMVQGPGPGLHHCSWEVTSPEHLGLIGEQARKAGHTNQWGIGRHVLGSNWFNYIQAPDGGWWESSFNIDYIPADVSWPAADHDAEDSFYLWGPELAPGFLDYTEVR